MSALGVPVHCPCGRTNASLDRESEHIRSTIGPMAQLEFDARHERHVEDEEDAKYLDADHDRDLEPPDSEPEPWYEPYRPQS